MHRQSRLLSLLLHQQHKKSTFSAKPHLPLCLHSPNFRDRALFASLALLHDHGGQFSDGGRSATDARSRRSVPQLAGQG